MAIKVGSTASGFDLMFDRAPEIVTVHLHGALQTSLSGVLDDHLRCVVEPGTELTIVLNPGDTTLDTPAVERLALLRHRLEELGARVRFEPSCIDLERTLLGRPDGHLDDMPPFHVSLLSGGDVVVHANRSDRSRLQALLRRRPGAGPHLLDGEDHRGL